MKRLAALPVGLACLGLSGALVGSVFVGGVVCEVISHHRSV